MEWVWTTLNLKTWTCRRQQCRVRKARAQTQQLSSSTARLSVPASAYLHWTDKRWTRRRKRAWREGAEGLGSACCNPWRQLSGQGKVHNSMKHATDVSELFAAEPVTILGASADVKFDTGDKEEPARALSHPPHFRWVLHQPPRCLHTYHLHTGKHKSDVNSIIRL